MRRISDDRMRSLWKQRWQLRDELDRNGGGRPIHDYTEDERATMLRCERAIEKVTDRLVEGLRQRGGLFYLDDSFPLVLDRYDAMIPVWPWTKNRPGWRHFRKALLRLVSRRQREAVAC